MLIRVPGSWLVPFTRIIALPVALFAICARAEDVQCRNVKLA